MNGLTQTATGGRRARVLRFGVLTAAALMLSLVAFSTSASGRAAESKPTIVLVHGAFASPAGWDGVADALPVGHVAIALNVVLLTALTAVDTVADETRWEADGPGGPMVPASTA